MIKTVKILALMLPLLYISCGETNLNNSNKQELPKSDSDLNMTSSTKPKDILGKFGLDIQNQKISLDINKTRSFIKKMEIEMHGKADEIQHKIEKADINFTRDMGINFSDEKVEIDLNQTKKMFQQINILMKEVLLDKNSSKY